jgi:hypothetical protein
MKDQEEVVKYEMRLREDLAWVINRAIENI